MNCPHRHPTTCRICREKSPRGQGARRHIKPFITPEPEGLDFECPNGLAWSHTAEDFPLPYITPDGAEAACAKCMDRGCPNVVGACCGERRSVRIVTACPKKLW